MCHKKLHETSEESQNSTEDRPAQNEDIVEEDEDHGDADSEPSNHSEEQEFSEEDLDWWNVKSFICKCYMLTKQKRYLLALP